jgi:hypothetical protein
VRHVTLRMSHYKPNDSKGLKEKWDMSHVTPNKINNFMKYIFIFLLLECETFVTLLAETSMFIGI